MKRFIYSIIALFSTVSLGFANEKTEEEIGKFNPTELAMHHVKDAHEFEIFGEEHILYLPIILWTDKGLVIFSSKAFEGDDSAKKIVEKDGQNFIKYHEKIYYASSSANAEGSFIKMEKDHPNNTRPWDFSITKNVFTLWLAFAILAILAVSAGRFYKSKKYNGVPKGVASVFEFLVVFVRDDIAIPTIGKKKYKKFMPYLLTVFFFIWLVNLFGLVPFFPFGANLSGNIAFTMTLALITFIITQFSSNANYWKHIFWTPGVPVPMKIVLAPIEFIGLFTKPFSLMIRLFANITAGHVIVLSLVSMIFIFKTYLVAPVSIIFVVFISLIEILVTALQAYIFTMLSSLYFGMATDEGHGEEH
ncbi:MAG: F0F1 ATP synthase subunit A [Flavobacteriaceae bacterium]|jgi:F-type H+-transporting ATPase subunit a|nr:F0F1 ATP synthase subunit A [Flavobacteriaceae bacterium]